MGLPSGTLWLDRPLGAKNVGSISNWYQWGALVGYKNLTQFDFTLATYEEQGLNLIHDNLTKEHDAAAVYYGGTAQIPSKSQIQELLNNTSVTISGLTFTLRSNINGNVIKIRAGGEVNGQSVNRPEEVFIWAKDFYNNERANILRIGTDAQAYYITVPRYYGIAILPVKSS